MKKLLILLFLLPLTTFAQNDKVLTGFWGIEFGSTKEKIVAEMLKKEGCKFNESISSEESLFFSNMKFAGRHPESISFSLFKDRMYNVIITLKSDSEKGSIELYKDLIDEVSLKYGKPTKINEVYDYPYKKGDGFELTAIKNDKANISTVWKFYPEKNKGNSTYFYNDILVYLDKNLDVLIAYTSEGLLELKTISDKIKNSSDF